MNAPIAHLFDLGNARELSAWAAEAYAGRATLRGALTTPAEESQGSTESHPTFIECAVTDTHALISQNATDLVIAFRGTADLRNWLTDLDWQKAPLYWSPGQVHRGFNAALDSIAEPLDRAIDPLDARRVWVTGHSLGGALAMLFALRLQVRRRVNVAGVYTFGQPRLGNRPFSLAYDALLKARTFRVVHSDDLVPRVPWLLGSYRHAGHEVFFPSAKITNDKFSMANFQSLPSAIENWQLDPSWFEKLPYDLLALYRELSQGQCALLADHHLKSYVDLLAAPCNEANPSLA